MKKIFYSFAWLLLFSMIPLTQVFANGESTSQMVYGEVEAEESGDQSQFVEIVKPANAHNLKPAKNSSTTLQEAYWYVNEKGEQVQVTTLKLSQADRGKSFIITFDLDTNEYVVEESRNLSLTPVPLATMEYFMGATYTTKDPVGVDLNRSRHELTWRGNSTDAWKVSRNATAWAANPSSLGTHWYVDINKYEGYVDQGKSIYSSSYHSYYNWDFGSDDKRTDVWHRVNLQGFNDGYTYVTAQNGKSGEGSSLLSFKLDTY